MSPSAPGDGTGTVGASVRVGAGFGAVDGAVGLTPPVQEIRASVSLSSPLIAKT